MVRGFAVVGLTAGTSTPDDVIDAVQANRTGRARAERASAPTAKLLRLPGAARMSYKVAMRTLSWILIVACIAAADTAVGKSALAGKDYVAARKAFTAAAEAGDAEAQYQLAQLHRQGLGVKANARIAGKWFALAAAQDHAAAQGEVGIAMWDAKKKRKEAVALIRKGVAAEHVRSMYYLAVFSFRGNKDAEKLPKDEMYTLFRRVAEQGHAGAQEIYASALRRGKIGGKGQPEEAEKWYRKAADQGHPDAINGLAAIELDRTNVPGGGTNITAMSRGFKLREKAALHGIHSAQHFLALGHLARGNYLESYVWTKIGSNSKYSRTEENPVAKTLKKKLAKSLKSSMKKVKQFTKPDDVRGGDRMAKIYIKKIRANMKLPRTWQEPAR